MEIHLSPNQEVRLAAIAHFEGRNTEHLVQSAIEKILDEDTKFRMFVQVGIDQANRGEMIDEEEMDKFVENLLKE